MQISSGQQMNVSNSVFKNNIDYNNGISKNEGGPSRKTVDTDTVTISDFAKNSDSKWKEISNKYNVSHISPNEISGMARELFDNKLISTDEYLSMYVPENINDNMDLKRNHLNNMSKDLYVLKQQGTYTPEALDSATRVVNILKRIG